MLWQGGGLVGAGSVEQIIEIEPIQKKNKGKDQRNKKIKNLYEHPTSFTSLVWGDSIY